MSILPVVRPAEMLRVLLKAGFRIVRTRGSHIWLQHPVSKRVTSVAMHSKDLLRWTVSAILKQAGISVREFIRLLRE